MISTEVQRTLVKSPPELWAELSDQESLARHLGELGEVRITRTEPETRIEWQAGDTSGTVLLKASGWGTKVKFTVDREMPAPDPQTAPAVEPPAEEAAPAEASSPPAPVPSEREAEPEAETGPEHEPEPVPQAAATPEPRAAAVAPRATPEQQDAGGPIAGATTESQPERIERRRFFARLFSRRRGEAPDSHERTSDAEPPAAGDDTAATAASSEQLVAHQTDSTPASAPQPPAPYEPIELPSTVTFDAVSSAIAPEECARGGSLHRARA